MAKTSGAAVTLKSDVRAIARIAGDESPRPALVPDRVPYSGSYALRGRWTAPEYTRLRNAAWAVRNSRRAEALNPVSLLLVLQESERLIHQGEPLLDVLEAYAELLCAP